MFKNVDQTVKKETIFVAAVVLILSGLMEAVFLIIGQWDYTVLLGNLLGGAVAVGNFFLLGLTIQKSLGLCAEDAKTRMKISQQLRLIGTLVICAIGAAMQCFNLIALLLPLLFPRIAMMLRGIVLKKEGGKK